MPNTASYGLFLSGGASNTNPNLSTGGAISAKQVFSMSPTYNIGKAQITSLDVIEAVGITAATDVVINWTGSTGVLSATYGTNTASLTPTASGLCSIIFAANRYITFRITDISMIGSSNASTTVRFAYNPNNLLDDVSSDEATLGTTDLRYVYFKNMGDVPVTNLRLFMEQSGGGDSFQLGLTSTGMREYASLTDSLSAGAIPTGGAVGFYIKRVVPPNITLGATQTIAQLKSYVSY